MCFCNVLLMSFVSVYLTWNTTNDFYALLLRICWKFHKNANMELHVVILILHVVGLVRPYLTSINQCISCTFRTQLSWGYSQNMIVMNKSCMEYVWFVSRKRKGRWITCIFIAWQDKNRLLSAYHRHIITENKYKLHVNIITLSISVVYMWQLPPLAVHDVTRMIAGSSYRDWSTRVLLYSPPLVHFRCLYVAATPTGCSWRHEEACVPLLWESTVQCPALFTYNCSFQVFICGSYPHWLFMTSRGSLRAHPMGIDGPVSCFSEFHNVNCPRGFLYFNKMVGQLMQIQQGVSFPNNCQLSFIEKLLILFSTIYSDDSLIRAPIVRKSR